MRRRFIRFWATVLTVLGGLVVAAGVVAGVVLTLLPVASNLGSHPALIGVPLGLVGALGGFLVGALVGAPLIAMGQGLRILLHQHARLARIERRLRPPAAPAAAPTIVPPIEAAHSLADRLRVRR